MRPTSPFRARENTCASSLGHQVGDCSAEQLHVERAVAADPDDRAAAVGTVGSAQPRPAISADIRSPCGTNE